MASTKRYFKATDGNVTVFRASGTRAYATAYFQSEKTDGRYRRFGPVGFSASSNGQYPTTEITKVEYEALVAAKARRVKAMGWDPARHTAPDASWVRNADLTEAGQ